MTLKHLTFTIGFVATFGFNAFSQEIAQNENYRFSVDLNNVQDDKLEISLVAPKITTEEAVYHLPKIVPGTYAIYDFGRYVSDFKAFDKKGKPLKVDKTDENSWSIKSAKHLYKISYKVDDTWDSPDIKGEHIFEPAGTNIDAGKSFSVNTFSFFGYFEGMKKVPYEVTFTKPEGFYGSTSLVASKTSPKSDTYTLPNYMDLADAPILYTKPDTTVLKIGGADILVSVFSPNKKADSKEIAADIKSMLEAQKEYLGGKLPIKKYAFLIVLSDDPNLSSYGALEHSYSSFYYLPEATSAELSQTVKDVASHEFFHILTPLSIHSEEIGDFNFIKPRMSRHLWMYEGLTEYAAHHMQVKYGLIDFKTYLQRQKDKMDQADGFDNSLPFTEMSENVLDTYKNQYTNVYQKGALIGLCLDIKLRKLSGGKYGTQNMMQDLAKFYGKDKSFKDGELFEKIVSLTYPEIREFFNKYVAGKEPLPFEETFASIGVKYEKSANLKSPTFGNIALGFDPSINKIYVKDIAQVNEFGKKMDYQKGDIILSVNGESFSATTAQNIIDKYKSTAKEGDMFEMIVQRNDANGKPAEKKLSSKVIFTETQDSNVLVEMVNPTPEQIALRKAWLSTEK